MRKNRSFKVTPFDSSTDTIISYFLGGFSIIFIILSIIKSIVSKGHVERVYGVLLASSFVMSITGIVFGIIGYKAEEGSMFGKRISIIISAIAFVISGIFLLKGM